MDSNDLNPQPILGIGSDIYLILKRGREKLTLFRVQFDGYCRFPLILRG
jgi:hypothetical protein